MSLVPPHLDDRRFEDLRKEAFERVRREFPEWTDFNPSDPGVALVELFAWFTDLMLFRMNMLPDKLHGELLNLLGMRPQPAQAAKAIIVFRPPPERDEGMPDPKLPAAMVPRRTQSDRISVDDGKEVVFETESDLAVVRRPLVAIHRKVRDTVDDLTLLNSLANRGYHPFGLHGYEKSELRLRIKVLKQDDPNDIFPDIMTLYLAVAKDGENERAALGATLKETNLVWEARRADEEGREQWERLEIVQDDTTSFTRDGFVRLGRPLRAFAHTADQGKSYYFELRCRVIRGFPLALGPRLLYLAINAVEAVAYSTEKEQDLGISNGLPGQSFLLRKRPVKPNSVSLITRQSENDPGEVWTEAPDFAGALKDQRSFTLDPGSGQITFGDDVRGKIPEAGRRVVALSYRSGGGSHGNLAARAIVFGKPDKFTATNPQAAVGGRDAETPDAMRQLAPARLRSRDRAVIASDYEAIARADGGMARALAVPGLHPDFPELDGQMPGTLTVFVVAPLLKNNIAPPAATSHDVEKVQSLIDHRRMIGSEVFVRAASVLKVHVSLKVRRAPEIAADQAKSAIRDALNAWLNDDARGFGTRIYATELWSVALQAKIGETRVAREIISLSVNVADRETLRISADVRSDQPFGKLKVSQVPGFVNGKASAVNHVVTLPSHAVPWGPNEHTVKFEGG